MCLAIKITGWVRSAFFILFIIGDTCSADETPVHYKQVEGAPFVGRLWLPDNAEQNPAILLIGGSGGGYEDQDAEWLSSLGFVVLNVRFFGTPGLPENLVNIPIEYFSNAVNWLKQHDAVNGGIGIFGHSKGTEAAILTAYYNPFVKAVVARSPSSIVWAGPGWSGFNESSWSWGNEPLSFHNVGLVDGAIWLSRILRKKKLINTRAMFENALKDKDRVASARLPVEHVKADLLFLSGEDDQQWPSSIMANDLIDVLDKIDFEYRYRHIAFSEAGHRPARPSKPDDTFANGGTEEGNNRAHRQTMHLVNDFFNSALRQQN